MFWSWLDPEWAQRHLSRGWLPFRFRRADYLGDAAVPLADAVRACASAKLGRPVTGEVRMLTHLRWWGHAFNPVSFYWVFNDLGAVDCIVAEITNTPWNERMQYVLDAAQGQRRWRFPKAFHISPFQGMDIEHDWSFSVPDERIAIHMINRQGGVPIFDATLVLGRLPWVRPALWRAFWHAPLMPVAALAAIYVHALRLWRRGAPFHAHPAAA